MGSSTFPLEIVFLVLSNQKERKNRKRNKVDVGTTRTTKSFLVPAHTE